MDHRSLRVANVIQKELGALLIREVDFGGAFVTITTVEVNDKLESAAVKVGVLPMAARDSAMRILSNVQGHLQHLLNKKMNIRPMPRISFVIDEGAENAARVEKLLLGEDNKEVK
jgi:ribosome-binding factor A